MRYFSLSSLVLLVAIGSLSAQQLPQFIQTQSEEGTLAVSVRNGGAAGYGDQFVIPYAITDETVQSEIPHLYIYDEDATIVDVQTIPEARGFDVSFTYAATAPDGNQAWIFGSVDPLAGSGEAGDLAIIHGDATGFDYGAINLGYDESIINGTATDQHFYAVARQRNVFGSLPGQVLIKVGTDLSLVDSLSLPNQEGYTLEYMLADESENFVLLMYRNFQEFRLVGINLNTDAVVSYTLPDLLSDCNGTPEQFYYPRGGVTNEADNFFSLLTSCGRILAVLPTGESFFFQGGPADPLANSTLARLVLENAGSMDEHYLILSPESYSRLSIEADTLTEFESGSYGFGFFPDLIRSGINANGEMISVGDVAIGGSFIISPATPDNWSIQAGEPIPLPVFSIPTGSELFNPQRTGNELFTVLQFDSQGPTGELQLLNPNTGTQLQSLSIEGNRGISAPQPLDNGNYVILRTVINPMNGTTDAGLVEFNPVGGEIAELASWNIGSGLQGAIFQRLLKASNGDLVSITSSLVFSPSFGVLNNVSRHTSSGTEVFNTTLPDSVGANFQYVTSTIDAEGNTYFFAPKLPQGHRITSLDPTGGLRYVTNVESALSFGFNNYRIRFNASGQLFAIGTAFDGEYAQAYLAEIDPATGQEFNFSLLAPAQNSFHLLGDFIPGTDSLVLFHNYISTEDAQPFKNRVLFFDEASSLFYSQEILATDYTERFLPSEVVVASNSIYVSGARRVPQFNDDFATIIGVDLSDLGLVNVDDFAQTTKLKVFPNPTANLVQISWDNPQNNNKYDLQLLTNDGRVLRRWRGELVADRTVLDVDLSQLAAGTYLLRLTTDTGVTTQRVVKQ